MNSFWKKLVSGFLSMLMVLSLCPVAALAETVSAPDPMATVEACSPSETPVYAKDGQASDPLGSARMETAFRFSIPPEKGVEVIHEEAVPVEQPEPAENEDGEAEDGEAAAEPQYTYVQHVHTEYPYHDWRAALVVSFDRAVAKGSVGLSTLCSNGSKGGVTGWHGFLLGKDLGAGSELKLSGSFGTSLTYGQLYEKIKEIKCGAFNLSSENVGTTMTAAIRIYEQEGGSDTGRYMTLASYRHTFAQVTEVNYVETESNEPEEVPAPPAGEVNGNDPSASGDSVNEDETGNENGENESQIQGGTSSDDTHMNEGNGGAALGDDSDGPADDQTGKEDDPVDTDPNKGEGDGEDPDQKNEDDDKQGDDNKDPEVPAADPEGEPDGGEEPDLMLTRGNRDVKYIVTTSSTTSDHLEYVARLSGGGEYSDGDSVTVIAYASTGFRFVGWYDQSDTSFGTKLSGDQSYTFTVTGNTDLVALYEVNSSLQCTLTIYASFFQLNNGAIQSNRTTYTYNAGETMFISYKDDTREFLYWVNESGNILSTKRDFSFILTGNRTVSSYFAEEKSSDSAAVVIFRNASRQVLLSRTYEFGQPITYPAKNPSQMGSVFDGWYIADASGNPSAIRATEENIWAAMDGHNAVIVVPGYIPLSDTYIVNVSYVDELGNVITGYEGYSEVIGIGRSKTFTAPDIPDYTFLYWKFRGDIVSYEKSCLIQRGIADTSELLAVYGEAGVTAEATIAITQTFATQEADTGKYTISNTAQWFAPEGCTVAEMGFVYTANSMYANAPDELIIGAQDTYKYLSGYTDNSNIHTFHLTGLPRPNLVIYERAYLIYRDPEGASHTIYSNMTSGSFDTLPHPNQACEHDWGPWIVTKEPTCTETGEKKHTCSLCEENEVEVIDALGHDWGAPSWEWIGDDQNGYTAAKATFICTRVTSHVETIQVEVTVSEGTGEDAGKTVYTATVHFNDNDYTETKKVGNSYTITWLNDDDSMIDTTTVEYGVVPTHADASKAATAEYTYTFAGWTPEVVAVTGEATYKATFTAAKNSYTITWLNDDDSMIDTTTVESGVVPTHADASKAATAEYTYTFAGWTPEVVAVTGEATYKATFTAAKNSYTITWLNDDDSMIDTTTVEYGVVPTHADASKAATAEYTYAFAGWSPAIEEVTGDATYTAQFSSTVNQYTVTFVDEDGTEIDSQSVEYNEKAIKPNDPTKENAIFVAWFIGDTEYDFNTLITEDVTLTAHWVEAVAKIGETLYETLEEAVAAAQNGDTIQMIADETLTAYVTFPAEKALTLDLGGHNVTRNGNCMLDVYGTLTLKDSGHDDNGTTVYGKLEGGVPVWLNDSANFTLEGAALNAVKENDGSGYGIIAPNSSVLTVSSGTITAVDCGIFATNDANVTINGGTITAHDYAISTNGSASGDDESADVVVAINGGALTSTADVAVFIPAGDFIITDGTITGATAIYQKSGNLTITGGTLTATAAYAAFNHTGDGCNATGDTIVVESCGYPNGAPNTSIKSGSIVHEEGCLDVGYYETSDGTLAVVFTDNNELTIPKDYKWVAVENAAAAYKLEPKDYIAENVTTGEKYETLEEAVAAAQNGDTITVLKNFTIDASKTDAEDRIVIDKAITIDFGEYTMSVPGSLERTDNWAALYIDADVTVKATTGGIDCQDKDDGECGVYAFNVRNDATLTIESGSYHGGGTVVQVQKGKAVIEGGTFTATAFPAPYGMDFVLNCIDANYNAGTASFEVNGGKFAGFDPQNNAADGANTNFVTANHVAIQEDEYYTVYAGGTVTFDTNGGTPATIPEQRVKANGLASKPQDPVKENYIFGGWFNGDAINSFDFTTQITEDITLTAKWTINSYTITFVNEDGTVLQSGCVAYGETPSYTGETPTKEATTQYTYTFSGWTPAIAEVTGDATYTATYSSTVNQYTVTVHHYLKGTTTKVVEDVTETVDYDTTYTANPVITYLEKDLTVNNYDPSQSITVQGEGVVITIYYTLPVTITANNATKTYGEADPALTATVTGTLEGESIDYSVGRVTGENIGTYAITPAGAAEQGYYTVTYVSGTLTINPIDVTVTIVGANNTANYDGEEHTVNGYTATASSDLYDVDNDFTFTGTAEATRTDVGKTNMGLAENQFANTNANFNVTFEVIDGYQTINPIDVTVTIVGANNTANYDGEEHTVSGYTATASSDLYDVDNDFTFSGTASATRTDAGTTNMGLAVNQFANTNANFNVTFEVADGYQEITRKTAKITINDIGKNYGETDPALTATVEDLVGSDTLNYTLTRAEGENVGTYTITATLGENPNYDVTVEVGVLTISAKALTVVVDPNQGKTYGETDPALTATVEGLVGSDTLNYTLARAAGEDVGEYAITITLGSNPNYDVTPTNGTFTISAKELKVTAEAKTKTYGNDDPALTYTAEGLVGSDTLSGALARVEGENVGAYAIQQGTLSAGNNYTINYTGANLTITPKQVDNPTIVLNPTEYYYYENSTYEPAVTVKDGDTVIPDAEYTVSYSNNTGVGTATVTVTNVPGNYTVNGTATFLIKEVTYTGPVWNWTGLTAATATFTGSDGSTKSENAKITNEVTTEATCTAPGVRTYTATATFNGQPYTDTKTEAIAALGHNYAAVVTAPTCTEQGYTTHTCSRCGDSYVDTYVNMLGHAWGASVYVWSEDNGTVTATRTCANDSSHVETETATATGAVKTPATCEAKGWTTYTATFTNAAFETQTKDVEDIPALTHNWGEPTWEWTGVESATATFICANGDHPHTETETGEAITSAAGEGNDLGYTVYTATVSFDNKTYTDTTRTPITYTITYNLDNGALAEGATNPTSYTVESDEITLNNPTKEGYTFAGWTGTDHSAATKTVTIEEGSTGNRRYTATWNPIVTFNINLPSGATAATTSVTMNPQTVTGAENEKLTANSFAVEGYTFTGWNTAADGNGTAYEDEQATTGITAPLTLYAQWDPEQVVAVTLNVYGGTLVTTGDGAYSALTLEPDQATEPNTYTGTFAPGTEYALPTAAQITKTGYAFGGWYTDEQCTDGNEATAILATASEAQTFWAKWTQLNTFTHSDNFANVDRYLYRAGNGNTVKLGSLFKSNDDGDAAVVSDNVIVTVYAADDNTSVSTAFGAKAILNDTLADVVYTKNASDWTQATLKFAANKEGPVQVVIKEGDTGEEYILNLEVVNANNATTATSATSVDIVLLNDVSGSVAISGGHTLYGNGFTVTDTRNQPSGTAGFVNITNGIADNVKFVGYEPTTAVASGVNNSGYAPAMNISGGKLYNCYISGGRYAVYVNPGTAYFKGTMIDGGAIGNMNIAGGDVILEDCITSTSTRGGLKGLGIHITNPSSSLTIKGTFRQYNWLTYNDMPSNYKTALGSVFNDANYAYSKDGKTYVNMGVFGLIDGQNFTETTMRSIIHDQSGNSYGYLEKTAFGYTGTLYTAKATLGSAEAIADPTDERMQYDTLPKFVFDYTNKNFIPNTGDDNYCIFDSATETVRISLKQQTVTDTFSWDPMILTATKFGNELDYTVTMNGVNYTDSMIEFSENGDYTVTYTITDPYNYSEALAQSTIVYSQEVQIHVTIVEPEAIIYHPEFSYASSWSSYAAKTVTIGSDIYVMPDVSATSSTVGSTTVGGQTVYYPIVTVNGKNSSGGDYYSGKIYCFAPAFSAINIKDLNKDTGATLYTYNSSTRTWPHGISATTGPGNSAYYGPASTRDPYGAGTGSTYEKYEFNANNGGLCYTSNEIERHIVANTKTVKFHYVGNDGITYYYYIQYKYNAVTYSSGGCFASGTMITLADGTQKAIEDVTAEDRILSWDFFNGEYTAQDISLLVDHGEDEYTITNMTFSDGTVLRTIADHGLFDLDQNKFVYILPENAESYIGHRFVKQGMDGGYDTVMLVDVEITTEITHAYSITAAYTSNAFAEGLLTVAPPEEFYNWVKMGDTLRYDTEWFNAQLDRYGTYDYSVFADYVTEKQFDQWNGKYLKIAVESGRITFEEILELIDMYKQYMPE